MHQITMALFVLLWLITDIHVAVGMHGLCNIRNSNQQKIPCDRMENEHPPGITGFTDKQHHKMDTKNQ